MKKNIIMSTSIAALALFGLNGCNSSDTTESGTIAITTLCSDSADISTYHTLLKGDVIQKGSNTLIPNGTGATPEYKIVMASDGTKKVCKISGDAVITR
jgi:hypothetical protein